MDAGTVVLGLFALLCCTAVAFFFVARWVLSDEAGSLWSMISTTNRASRSDVAELEKKISAQTEWDMNVVRELAKLEGRVRKLEGAK